MATEVFLDAQGPIQNPAVLRIRVAKKGEGEKNLPLPAFFGSATRPAGKSYG
jgi:hypothetical protein